MRTRILPMSQKPTYDCYPFTFPFEGCPMVSQSSRRHWQWRILLQGSWRGTGTVVGEVSCPPSRDLWVVFHICWMVCSGRVRLLREPLQSPRHAASAPRTTADQVAELFARSSRPTGTSVRNICRSHGAGLHTSFGSHPKRRTRWIFSCGSLQYRL